MKKNIPKILIISFFLFQLAITTFTQQWTDPINISNLPGLDNQPDLCIDKNGVLHCVFTHKLASNWRKIYYTKSTNDGQTWTIPEDISLNPDSSLMFPHIVADTNNILYVTYDYNIGNPAATLIKLKTFDGNQWSTPFVVSEGMYNSDYNKLCIDHNNRIYVFWGYLNHWTNYRYYENGQWSDVFSPYPEQGILETISVVVDGANNLHCIGWGINNGASNAVYFSYLYDEAWTDWTIISPPTDIGSDRGGDIDIDTENLPTITYRQKTYGTIGPNNDSTMYTFYDGSNWSVPELVVNDPYGQRIAIDAYNRLNIFDWEKIESGYKIVHYQKFNNLWQGYIVDSADFYLGSISLIKSSQKLYIAYYKSDIEGEGEIYFTHYDIVTGKNYAHTLPVMNSFQLYPNPFRKETKIEIGLIEGTIINVSVFDLNGRQIKTIDERKISTGTHKYKWNGTDKNGKEVNPGTYLIRLQAGRHVITKPVEKVK